MTAVLKVPLLTVSLALAMVPLLMAQGRVAEAPVDRRPAQPGQQPSSPMQFTGPNALLESAIEQDDAAAVATALARGALVNARGRHDITPLEYAIGRNRPRAAQALVAAGADPNLRDAEGDSAVSLAVQAYARAPGLLALVLAAGGDPNIANASGEPVIQRFINDHNLPAIAYLHAHGADLNRYIDGNPPVVDAAFAVDWDVVWCLIELGADLDAPRARDGLLMAFKVPRATLPDSPLYAAKVRVWRRLKALGLDPVPPFGMSAGS